MITRRYFMSIEYEGKYGSLTYRHSSLFPKPTIAHDLALTRLKELMDLPEDAQCHVISFNKV